MSDYEVTDDSKGKAKSYSTKWEKLKQQKLSAWQPVYSTKTLSPIFIFFGLILIPIGALIFLLSKNIQEIPIDYTDCKNAEGDICADVIGRGSRDCSCSLNFEIKKMFEGDVYLYYALTKFYQNHREYVSSRDDNQLFGDIGSENGFKAPSSDCAPFDKDADGRTIFPCGAIASSMFNDTIKLIYHGDTGATKTEVKLLKKGIAWDSDKKYKFRNPAQFPKDHVIWTQNFTQPRDWDRNIWQLDPEDDTNNGVQNEDFIIWMRVSALPNFRKLYRKVDTSSIGSVAGLPPGNYSFDIDYEYEVKSFGGTKSIILTETSILGGRNLSLGIMSMSAGSVVLVLGLMFLLLGFTKRKSWEKRKSSVMKDYGTRDTTTMFSRNKKTSIKSS